MCLGSWLFGGSRWRLGVGPQHYEQGSGAEMRGWPSGGMGGVGRVCTTSRCWNLGFIFF